MKTIKAIGCCLLAAGLLVGPGAFSQEELTGQGAQIQNGNPVLERARTALVGKLASAGVLDDLRAARIARMPLVADGETPAIRVAVRGESFYFLVPAGIREQVREKALAETGKNRAAGQAADRAAEMLLAELSGAIAQADLALFWESPEKAESIPAELKRGFELCMQVSALNLLMKRAQTVEEYAASLSPEDRSAAAYMTSGPGKKWADWNGTAHVYVPSYEGLESRMTSCAEGAAAEEAEAREISALLEGKTVSEPTKNTATVPPSPQRLEKKQISKKSSSPLDPLFLEMERASSRDAYIEIFKKLPDLPEQRRYRLGVLIPPHEIPFERLSASMAARGTLWYGPSQTKVFPSPEAVQFYSETLYPKFQAFFRKIALKEQVKRIEATVEETDQGKMINLALGVDPLCKDMGFKVILIRPVGNYNFRSPKKGSKVMYEASVFAIPEAYKAFASDQRTNQTSTAVTLTIKNLEDEILDSGKKHVPVGLAMYTNSGSLVIMGWGLGEEKGCLYLNRSCWFDTFAANQAVQVNKSRVRFEVSFQEPVVLAAEAQEKEKARIAEARELGFWAYTGLTIVFLPWLALPFMIYVLVKEHRRRFVPLPLPEGWSEEDYSADRLAPECREAIELGNSLERREWEGESTPFFTHRQEIEQGYAILKKLVGLNDKNADTIFFINDFGTNLNEAQKRYMNGNKWLLAAVVVVFLLIAAQMIFFADSYLAAQFWISFPFIYLLALKCPAYKIGNPEPFYYKAFQWVLKLMGIGSLFAAMDVASDKYATIYRDAYGNYYKERDDGSGCLVAAFMVIFVLILSPFLLLLNCICNFLRNYVTPK